MKIIIISVSLSVSVFLSLQTCRLTFQWYVRTDCISEGSWPTQTVTWTNRTEELQQDTECPSCFVSFHFFVEKLEYASLCTCRSKRKHFLGITWGGLHKKTLCECNEIIKAYAVLCVATEDALFFLFSLWLSSSKATENVIYFRSSTFSLWTYFWC